MTKLRNTFNELLCDDTGLSSVEYALLLAFVAIGIIAAITNLQGAVKAAFNAACKQISATATCT